MEKDNFKFLRFISENDIISVKITFDTKKYSFSDISYALFSTNLVDNKETNSVDSKEINLCSVVCSQRKSKGKDILVLEFQAKETDDKDEIRKIVNCRNIAYSYLKFACIAIIVQSPEEKLDASYFIRVSACPFQIYPGLGELVYEEQFEFCCVVFNSSTEFKNEIIRRFVEAIDGFSPSTYKYRISFLNSIAIDNKYFYSRPIDNNDIPSCAKLSTQKNKLNTAELKKISLDYDIWKTDNKSKNTFYATSFVDIGQPEASMVAASALSNSLFLTPDFGELRYDQYYLNEKNKYNNLRFLFRSRNYEDPYENMRAFAAAFVSSTNIIVPFTVPCYDVVEMLSLFVDNPPECVGKMQRYINESDDYKKKYFKKKIIFYIDIPQKGAKNVSNAVDNAYRTMISIFEKMEIFNFKDGKSTLTDDDHIFKLCKSRIELIEYLKKKEKDDCKNLENRKNKFISFVIEDNIQDGIDYFFQNDDI